MSDQAPGMQDVRRLVRQARERAGHGLRGLAEHSGVAMSTIQGLETGSRSKAPQSSTLRALEDALHMVPFILDDIMATGGDEVSLDQILVEPPVRQLTDTELLWELTERLQARNAEVEQLRARVADLEDPGP